MSTGVLLDRTEWRWHLVNGKLTPTLTEIHPAPQQLVEVLSCNCHVLKNQCPREMIA